MALQKGRSGLNGRSRSHALREKTRFKENLPASMGNLQRANNSFSLEGDVKAGTALRHKPILLQQYQKSAFEPNCAIF